MKNFIKSENGWFKTEINVVKRNLMKMEQTDELIASEDKTSSWIYDSPTGMTNKRITPPKLKTKKYIQKVETIYDLDWNFLKVNENLWSEDLQIDTHNLDNFKSNFLMTEFPKEKHINTGSKRTNGRIINLKEKKENFLMESRMKTKENKKSIENPQIWNFNTITTKKFYSEEKENLAWSFCNNDCLNKFGRFPSLNLFENFLQREEEISDNISIEKMHNNLNKNKRVIEKGDNRVAQRNLMNKFLSSSSLS